MAEHMIYDDPRLPPDVYRHGHRSRDMAYEELRGRGFSEAEAWSVYHGQWQSVLSPLHHVVDGVITAKAADGKPLLSHERTHIRISMLKTWTGHLDRKGAEWFGRYYGTERLVATQAQTLCADDIERTSR